LRGLGLDVASPSAIIALRVPAGMDIRRAARRFHELGIFVNSVEYPVVPVGQQRFRISLTATHTRADIDRLVEAVATVWAEQSVEPSSNSRGAEPKHDAWAWAAVDHAAIAETYHA
jgi:glycine C-acetyltransferase